MSRRFFLDNELASSGSISITKKSSPEEFHHLTRVLRLQVGDRVIIVNGRGRETIAEILAKSKDELLLQIKEVKEQAPEKGPKVILCQALLKGAKMDWLVEKITELGIAEFYPLITERVVRADTGQRPDRWKRITQSAAKQSGNPHLPKLHPAIKLPDFFRSIPLEKQLKILLHPGQDAPLLLALLEERVGQASFENLFLFLGPEGGFSEAEQKFLLEQGLSSAQLGQTILRGETAGIVASALARQAISLWL